ncbi:hypothetical protein LY78DRAFT_143777 [Colletotrichum sublineola]|nr:hypothetical protein LY78DRAFT_143777 [Colletotrichum sublineola]
MLGSYAWGPHQNGDLEKKKKERKKKKVAQSMKGYKEKKRKKKKVDWVWSAVPRRKDGAATGEPYYFRNPGCLSLAFPSLFFFFPLPHLNHHHPNSIPRDNEVALNLLKGVPLKLHTTLRRESCPPLSLSCKRPLWRCLCWAPLQSSSPSRHSIPSYFRRSSTQAFTIRSPPPGRFWPIDGSLHLISPESTTKPNRHSPGYERPIPWKKKYLHIPPFPTSKTSTPATPDSHLSIVLRPRHVHENIYGTHRRIGYKAKALHIRSSYNALGIHPPSTPFISHTTPSRP